MPLVSIPHPLAGNSSELVRAKALAIAAEVVSALTASTDILAARYAGRFLTLTERRLDGGAVCIDEVCALDPAFAAPQITLP